MPQTHFDLKPFVGASVERVSQFFNREMRIQCRYCAEGRDAEKVDGGWYHRVARGGDLGQYEPCAAAYLRRAYDATGQSESGSGDTD